MTVKLLSILCLLFCCLIGQFCLASDWEEDSEVKRPKHGIPAGKDTVILDRSDKQENSKPLPAHGGMLQGSATAIRTKVPVPAPSYSALQARVAARQAQIERLENEAYFFLQKAEVNKVTPPSVFRNFIEKTHPGFLGSAENDESALLLVKGRWDDSTKPLQSFGLKYKAVKTRQLDELSLDKCKILIIDCAGEIPRGAVQKVRDFVAAGGYLLSTDWTLQNVLERSFPGYLQWNRDNTEGVVTDAFILEPQSSLMKGLNGRFFTWKLDRLSQCVRVLKTNSVHVIARSSRLAKVDPQALVLPDPLFAGGLALEFEFGHGKVLHLVGHFENCAASFKPNLLPDPDPQAGISLRQVLASNFIIEALTKGKEPQKTLDLSPSKN